MIMDIRKWRQFLGYTQREIAEMFSISYQAYSQKEKGLAPFTDKEKIIFRDLLREYFPNITIDDIFFKEITLKFSVK